MITNYEKEFDEVFGNFEEAKLPKDALYYSIKKEIDAEESKTKKNKEKDLNQDKKVLPTIHDTETDRINDQIHKDEVQKNLKEMVEKGESLKMNENKKPLQAMVDFEEENMAFKGNFEAIDDEIKVQVKAMIKGDFEKMKKVRQGELSKEDIKKYID